jgi:hypothetical protein
VAGRRRPGALEGAGKFHFTAYETFAAEHPAAWLRRCRSFLRKSPIGELIPVGQYGYLADRARIEFMWRVLLYFGSFFFLPISEAASC